jgi:hypothetical protein
MLKTTNRAIFQAKDALQRLLSRTDIPAKYAINVLRFAKKYNPEYETIDTQRLSIFRKYGEEKDKVITVPTDSPNYATFLKEVNELLDAECKFDAPIIVLPGNIDALILSLDDLIVLEPFIKFAD